MEPENKEFFDLDVNDDQSVKDYIDFCFPGEKHAFNPFYLLRQKPNSSYVKDVLPPFTNRIHVDGETGVRWSYGDKWYEDFGEDKSGENRLPGLVHRINSDGYAWPEFVQNPDVLTLGCSVSSGVGLSDTFTWAGIISHVKGLTVNNVSMSGSSPAQMVYYAFNNIAKYGAPKSIYFLCPPLNRYFGPRLQEWTNGSKRMKDWLPGPFHYNEEEGYYVDEQNKIYFHNSIDGHKTILPLDVIATYNLSMIDVLAMYCKANGIELRLSSWHKHTYVNLRLLNYKEFIAAPQFLLKGFFQKNTFDYTDEEKHYDLWGFPPEISPIGSRSRCCDKKPVGEWQDAMWDYALDINKHRFYPHPGLHMQIHLAELMTGSEISVDQYGGIRAWHEGTKFEPNDLDRVGRIR